MNLKKITAIALGAVMTVSMAVPTFAADDVETVTDGKLTVATSPVQLERISWNCQKK